MCHNINSTNGGVIVRASVSKEYRSLIDKKRGMEFELFSLSSAKKRALRSMLGKKETYRSSPCLKTH